MSRVLAWLRAALWWPLRRGRLEREMREEMALHLERSAARLLARGLSPAEAAAAARREFGGVDQLEEQARDARGGRWLESGVADVRFAMRHFRRTPLTTATMVLVLALGIGANIAVFTVVRSIYTQPAPGIPYDAALVRIRASVVVPGRRDPSIRELSYAEFQAYRARTDLFSTVEASTRASVVIDVDDAEHGVLSGEAQFVTPGWFATLGVRPVIGTGLPLLPADGAADDARVAVISHELWTVHLGGAADVIGRTIRVNDQPVTVAGVAPPGFGGTTSGGWRRKVWLPLAARPLLGPGSATALASPDSAFLNAVARLAPGVTSHDATPAVRSIAQRAAAAVTAPPRGPAQSAEVVALLADNGSPGSGREMAVLSTALTAFALLLLLVTCTNVSTLLVGSALARRREIAVRLSLGAGRPRLVRQLLTESALVAVAAAILGTVVVWWLLRAFGAHVPEVRFLLDGRMVAFTVAVGLGTGILFGVAPALHATRFALGDVLKDAAAAVAVSRSLLQRGLVVAQIALTQPLLVGLIATVLIIMSELHGRPATALYDRLVTVQVAFVTRATGLPGAPEAARAGGAASAFAALDRDLTRVQQRLAAVPGVLGVVRQQNGYGVYELSVHPGDAVAGQSPDQPLRVRTHFAPPGYFALLEIPILRGRDFSEDESRARSDVIIIGDDLARRLWGTTDPIGRRLRGERDSTSLVVVGVVDDARAGDSDVGSTVRIFVPHHSLPASLLVRTAGPAEPLIPALRAVLRAEAPHLPGELQTLAAAEEATRRSVLRGSAAAAAGGLLALFLSAIGLYAVIAFAVGQRTREIGIRTALGAGRGRVVGMFFARGLRLCVLGLAIGLPLSLVALRLLAGSTGMPPVSLPVLAVLIATLVTGVSSLATWIPARRAAAVDPLSALRSE